MNITHTLFIFIAVIEGENRIKCMHSTETINVFEKKQIILIFCFLSVFCWANPSVTWFQAQTFCRTKNLTLTLRKNASKNFYWTAFYQKTSPWIKIIGKILLIDVNLFIIYVMHC